MAHGSSSSEGFHGRQGAGAPGSGTRAPCHPPFGQVRFRHPVMNPVRLYINDVAVRDGFQIEKTFVPTATKVELINQLSRTGLHKIEVTSFVSPKAVPMLADANDVLGGIERVPGVVYVALVPNIRGAQNAAAVAKKPDELNGVVSASETHNRANINRTHEQSLSEMPTMVKVAHEAGMKITMSLSTTFGCPFEGHVHEDVVFEFVERFRG